MTSPQDAQPQASDAQPPSICSSRQESRAALEWLLIRWAQASDAQQLVIHDPDFSEWPLGQPSVVDALGEGMRRRPRPVVMVVSRFDLIERLHPRWVAWRRQWSHMMEVRAPHEEVASTLLAGCWSADWAGFRALAPGLSRGVLEFSPERLRAQGAQIDALLQRSEPAFPVSTIGL